MAAIPIDRISRVIGYELETAPRPGVTVNLPQRIVIFGEANTANQSGLAIIPVRVLNATEAGQTWGFGSPIHQIMRILRAQSGDVLGSIQTYVLPIPEPTAGTPLAAVRTITITGAVTATALHTVVINGRRGVDNELYTFSVAVGNTTTEIATAVSDAINAVNGAPVIASSTLGVVTLTSKWTGATSEDLNVIVDTGGVGVGLNYVVATTVVGGGTPISLASALSNLGTEWTTIILNQFTTSDALDALEVTNGLPAGAANNTVNTGKFIGEIFRPFVAYSGTINKSLSSIEALVGSRLNQLTNALCVAPGSDGMDWEAAANYVVLAARTFNDSPESDITGQFLPDMPVGSDIGEFAVSANRDAILKVGSSTATTINGRYQIQDLATTYRPVGEVPPQFRFVRTLMQDFNIAFRQRILIDRLVIGKVLVNDTDTVTSLNAVRPKDIRQAFSTMFDLLAADAIITNPDSSKASIVITFGGTNPDRVDINFDYQRTGLARVVSTTATAMFAQVITG